MKSRKYFLRSQRSCVPGRAKVAPHAADVLGNVFIHTGGTGSEGIKGTWRAAETWHCESPGKATGESAASVAVDGPGLKGSGKKAEVRHLKGSL